MRLSDPPLLRLLHFEYDECVLCGITKSLHLHHVLLRSQGGDDVRANILPLCLDDHEGYHLRRADLRKRLAAYILEHRPDTREYLAEKLGGEGAEHWFERHAEQV